MENTLIIMVMIETQDTKKLLLRYRNVLYAGTINSIIQLTKNVEGIKGELKDSIKIKFSDDKSCIASWYLTLVFANSVHF